MRRWTAQIVLLAFLGFATTNVSGCSSRASYVHPNVDFSHMKRAAILPFRNLSNDNIADERVQSIFLMELLRADILVILDPRETRSGMLAIGLTPGAELTPEQVQALGKQLRVDALFFGTVEEYGYGSGDRRRGPEVTAVFGMKETETGVVVWRSQVHETGSSTWRRIFGHPPKDVFSVSQTAVRRGLGTLLE